MHEFQPWPKTTRLFRDIIVTEKIDGTNAAIHATPLGDWEADLIRRGVTVGIQLVQVDGFWWGVSAQSRKRIISPGKSTDNFGFAAWVYDNAAELVRLLGEGLHYGEWWGAGIQRGYGAPKRCFSLFNVDRYDIAAQSIGTHGELPVRIGTVPVLYRGPFSEGHIRRALEDLKEHGSHAAWGFASPEGICVYHTASRTVTKVTLDANDAGKWEA